MRFAICGLLCLNLVFSVPQASLADEETYLGDINIDSYAARRNNPENNGDSEKPETLERIDRPYAVDQNDDTSPDDTNRRKENSYRVVMKQTYKIREPVKYNVSRVIKTKVTRSRPVVRKIYRNRYENSDGALSKIYYAGRENNANVEYLPLSADVQVDVDTNEVTSDQTLKAYPQIEVNEMARINELRSQNQQNYHPLELLKQNDRLTSRGQLQSIHSYAYVYPKTIVNYALNPNSNRNDYNKRYERVFNMEYKPEILNNYVYDIKNGLRVTGNKYPDNYKAQWYQTIGTLSDNDEIEKENQVTENQKVISAPTEHAKELSEFGKGLIQLNNFLNDNMHKSKKRGWFDGYDQSQSDLAKDSSIYTIKIGGGYTQNSEVNNNKEVDEIYSKFDFTRSTTPLANSADITSAEADSHMLRVTIDKETKPPEKSEHVWTITPYSSPIATSEHNHVSSTTIDSPKFRERISAPIVSKENDGTNVQPIKEGDELNMNDNRSVEPEEQVFTEKFTDWTRARHTLLPDDEDLVRVIQKSNEEPAFPIVSDDDETLSNPGERLDENQSGLDNPKTLRPNTGKSVDGNQNLNVLLEKLSDLRLRPDKELHKIEDNPFLSWEVAHKIDTSTNSDETLYETTENPTLANVYVTSPASGTLRENPNRDLQSVTEFSSDPVTILNETGEKPKDLRYGYSNTFDLIDDNPELHEAYEKKSDFTNNFDTINYNPENIREFYSGYGDGVTVENPKRFHTFVPDFVGNFDKYVDSRPYISQVYSPYGDLLSTEAKPKEHYSGLLNTLEKAYQSSVLTPHEGFSAYAKILGQANENPIVLPQKVYEAGGYDTGYNWEESNNPNGILKKISNVYSGYDNVLQKTDGDPNRLYPNLVNTSDKTVKHPLEKLYDVSSDTGVNVDEISSQKGILEKVSEFYSTTSEAVGTTNEKPTKLNVDIVNSLDETNKNPVLALKKIYEVNTDVIENVDETIVSPNGVFQNVTEINSAPDKTSEKIGMVTNEPGSISHTIKDPDIVQNVVVEEEILEKSTTHIIPSSTPELNENQLTLEEESVLPLTTIPNVNSLDTHLPEVIKHPKVTEELEEVKIKATLLDLQTDLTEHLRINNIPDLLVETEPLTKKQSEPENKSNDFDESAWTLFPLDDDEDTGKEVSVEEPDENFQTEESQGKMNPYSYINKDDVNEGLQYPELEPLRMSKITHTTVNLPTKYHYVQKKLNYHDVNDVDENKYELVHLCKLARVNLNRLRNFVSRTYGLNTKTAEESDLITIIYIMGTLNEARKSDLPVENIVDDLQANLRRLGELRKMLCKDIDDNDHNVENFDDSVENNEDITFHANILHLFDQYILGRENKKGNLNNKTPKSHSVPDHVKIVKQNHYEIKPHTLEYTKEHLYVTRPDTEETVNTNSYVSIDHNTVVTKHNTQPVKTNVENIDQNAYDIEPDYENSYENLYTFAPDNTENVKFYTPTPYYVNNKKPKAANKPRNVNNPNDKLYTIQPDHTGNLDTYTLNKNINPETPAYFKKLSLNVNDIEPEYGENTYEYTISPNHRENRNKNVDSITPSYANTLNDKLYKIHPDEPEDIDTYTIITDKYPDATIFVDTTEPEYVESADEMSYTQEPDNEHLSKHFYSNRPAYEEISSHYMYTYQPDYTDNVNQNEYPYNENYYPYGTPYAEKTDKNLYNTQPKYVANGISHTKRPDYNDKLSRELYTENPNDEGNTIHNIYPNIPDSAEIYQHFYNELPIYKPYTDQHKDDSVSVDSLEFIDENLFEIKQNLYPLNLDELERTNKISHPIDVDLEGIYKNAYTTKPDSDYEENVESIYTVDPNYVENVEQNLNPNEHIYTLLPDYTDDINPNIHSTYQYIYPVTPGYVDNINQNLYPKESDLEKYYLNPLSPVNKDPNLYTMEPASITRTNEYPYTDQPIGSETTSQNEFPVDDNKNPARQNYVESIENPEKSVFIENINQEFYPVHLVGDNQNLYTAEPDYTKTNEEFQTSKPNYIDLDNYTINPNKYTVTTDDVENNDQWNPVLSDSLKNTNDNLYTHQPDYVDNYSVNHHKFPVMHDYMEDNDKNLNPISTGFVKHPNDNLYYHQSDSDDNYSVNQHKYPVRQDHDDNNDENWDPIVTGYMENTNYNVYTRQPDFVDNYLVNQHEYPVMHGFIENNNQNWNPISPGFAKNTNDNLYYHQPDSEENYLVDQHRYPLRQDYDDNDDENWNQISVDYVENTNENMYTRQPVLVDNYPVNQHEYPVHQDYVENNDRDWNPIVAGYVENNIDNLYYHRPGYTDNYSVNQYEYPGTADINKINQYKYPVRPEYVTKTTQNLYINQPDYAENIAHNVYPSKLNNLGNENLNYLIRPKYFENNNPNVYELEPENIENQFYLHQPNYLDYVRNKVYSYNHLPEITYEYPIKSAKRNQVTNVENLSPSDVNLQSNLNPSTNNSVIDFSNESTVAPVYFLDIISTAPNAVQPVDVTSQTLNVKVNSADQPSTMKPKSYVDKVSDHINILNKPFEKPPQTLNAINSENWPVYAYPKSNENGKLSDDNYKQLLEELKQYDFIKYGQTPKNGYAYDINTLDHNKNEKPYSWNDRDWFKSYYDNALKKPGHFNVYLNDKKINFRPGTYNKSVLEKLYGQNVRINGYLHKVDLEALVNMAHYVSASYDSQLATKELSLLLEVRDKIDISIVTNVIWNEILRLRTLGVFEENIIQFVHKLVADIVPYAFRDSQKCQEILLKHLLSSIKELESNDM
ncbi:uncharacterized protein LOC128681090 isoform X2 [Plodia interpunctella]|uniref:uncharacterized protein LOC128681090 isoform X2 n=1 Tax=Plodia interpunctella TaxID=58824 RepID=UPI0023678EAC|nr:uncharacterized protein LOC128681090 isoform X2 [Plodia interpunctella]